MKLVELPLIKGPDILNITGVSHDDFLNLLIKSASAQFATLVERAIWIEEREEIFDISPGTWRFRVFGWPIIKDDESPVKVYYDPDQVFGEDTLVDSSLYRINYKKGEITFLTSLTEAPGAIKIISTGGMADQLSSGYGVITFTGSGLNDLVVSGTPTERHKVQVQVDGIGEVDTFKWSLDEGETWEAELVAMATTAQELQDGIYVAWAAKTGHTLGEHWDFQGLLGFIELYPDIVQVVAAQVKFDYQRLKNIEQAAIRLGDASVSEQLPYNLLPRFKAVARGYSRGVV